MKSLGGGPFFAFNLSGEAARTPAPHQLRHYHSRKVPPPSRGLKQSQAFQDGIIS